MITNFFVGFVITSICVAPIVILVGIIMGFIYLIRTKLISTTVKILIIMIILLFIAILLVNFAYVEKPDDSYMKMKRFSDNKSFIGLSKEQVVELLGEPEYESCEEDRNLYSYDAGNVFRYVVWRKHTLWSHTSHYAISINFDKTDKVESTFIKEYIPSGG